MNTTLPAISTAAELVLPDSAAANRDSLVWWVQEYWNKKVAGRAVGTVTAKKNDLQLFFDFFGAVVGSDQVDFWTPTVSLNFKSWLLEKEPSPSRRHSRAYAPTSINRILATLRHFATFIGARREKPFEAGYPLEDVGDLTLESPEWNGLSKIQLMRLQAALDQLTQLSTRANQRPLLKRSVFTLSLITSLLFFQDLFF